MKNFYLTFGQQYRCRETHPASELVGAHITPDAWVRIVAADEDRAREIAFQVFGDKWSMLYDGDFFGAKERKFYPEGELLRITDPVAGEPTGNTLGLLIDKGTVA